MYLIAYLRTYYRIITDKRMIYKKGSEKKTRGKGANGTQGNAGLGKAGPPCGAHDSRGRGGGKESFRRMGFIAEFGGHREKRERS